MKVDGICLCGQLTWSADIDETQVDICHCADCKTLSGSAFWISAPAIASSFRFLTGTPKTYVKVAASGRKRVLAFCPECGTSVYSSPAPGEDGYFGLRVGSLRQRTELKPTSQSWCASEFDWLDSLDAIPKTQTQ